ncbi:uncharacterized protein LOC143011610 isoform X2 [Genypterus blacodes]|uniref:uncharacterized protein LOC143011610 isoform X2 n=1 Tax=Genypterus blacodes TaxID=154954 RepID=UPI003F757DD3
MEPQQLLSRNMLPPKPPRRTKLSINSYESVSSQPEPEPEYQDLDSPSAPTPSETTCMENPAVTTSSQTEPPSLEPEYQDPDPDPDPDPSMPPISPEDTRTEDSAAYNTVENSEEPEYEEPDSPTIKMYSPHLKDSAETECPEDTSFYEPVAPLEEPELQEPDSATAPDSPDSPDSPETAESLYDTLPPPRERLKQEPDSTTPDVTEGNQSELRFKPKPRPRSKQLKASLSTDSSVDSVDENANKLITKPQQEQNSPGCKTSDPDSPSSGPPNDPNVIYCTISDMHRSVNNGSPSPASRPQPARPPPPNIYYERPPPGTGLKPQGVTGENQKSKMYAALPPTYNEAVRQYGTVDKRNSTERGADYPAQRKDGPEVPPRPDPTLYPKLGSYSSNYKTSSSLRSTTCEKQQPPPPSIKAPPPPHNQMYNDIQVDSYLKVLPGKHSETSSFHKGYPTNGSTVSHNGTRHSRVTTRQSTFQELEEINGMLRWLRRVERNGNMAPSLYGLEVEEEVREFNKRAECVRKGMRLFNILMMRRSESLREQIYELTDISDGLDKMIKKNKTTKTAGGATGAAGGAAVVMGIALAPATLGASLIITAIGAGVAASAGGISAHKFKVNKKIVNRKAVDRLVSDYRDNIEDLEHCLAFILGGMNEMRRHDFARLQRGGAQLDALKMAHLSQSVFKDDMNKPFTPAGGGVSSEKLLRDFVEGMDECFKTVKGEQKLRESKESSFSSRVRLLAQNLEHQLMHMSHMWELFCQM